MRQGIPDGARYLERPTWAEYNAALRRSLRYGGVSHRDADILVEAAQGEQSAAGFTANKLVPRIPGRGNLPQELP